MTNPHVTVLVCTYNGAYTIVAAIDSALSQRTKYPFEVVVVDDGSTDGTYDILRQAAREENRVTVARMPVNSGLPVACNAGLRVSRGTWFVRLDDDDILPDGALERLCGATSDGWLDMVYGDRLAVDPVTGTGKRIEIGVPAPRGWISRLSACGVMMRRDRVALLGGYRNIFWHEYDLYMRYILQSEVAARYVREVVYVHASRPGNGTHASSEKMKRGWDELAGIWGEGLLREVGLTWEVA